MLADLARQLFDAAGAADPFDPAPGPRRSGPPWSTGTSPTRPHRPDGGAAGPDLGPGRRRRAALTRVGAVQGALAAGYADAAAGAHAGRAGCDPVRPRSTAQDEAERAARASEARFRAVFAGAAIGIGVGDVDGTHPGREPGPDKMLGYPVDEMRRRNVGEFMHPDDTGRGLGSCTSS